MRQDGGKPWRSTEDSPVGRLLLRHSLVAVIHAQPNPQRTLLPKFRSDKWCANPELPEPSPEAITRIANELQERRGRARKQGQVAVLDVYERGPNLWLDADPRRAWEHRCDQIDNGFART